MKKKLFAILMSLTMILSFMPAMAFAADGAADEGAVKAAEIQKIAAAQQEAAETEALLEAEDAKAASAVYPKSVTFTSTQPIEGIIGTKYGQDRVEGSEFTVTFSNGSVQTYKYLEGYWDEESEEDYEDGYYRDGDRNRPLPEKYYTGIDTENRITEGENAGMFYIGNDDLEYPNNYAECPVTVIGVPNEEIKAVKYTQNSTINGVANYGSREIEYTYLDKNGNYEFAAMRGDVITVTEAEYTYDEDTGDEIKTYVDHDYTCQTYTDEDGEKNIAFIRTYVDEDGEECIDRVYPDLYDDQVEGEWTWLNNGTGTGEVTVSVDGVDAPEKLIVNVPAVKHLVGAKLTLASGFEPIVSVGQNDYIGADAFYGKGNKLTLEYSDGSTKVCKFNENYYGFIDPTTKEEAWFTADLPEQKITLEKDKPTEVTFEYGEDIGEDDWDSVKFTYTVTATKVAVKYNYATYQYTGKVIKPKVVLKTVYGNQTLPKSAYSFKMPKNKAIDQYWFPIKLKGDYYADGDGANVLYFGYVIGPYTPTIVKKAVAAKKGFTVKWKALSKAKKKQVSGFVVEYSLHKNFDSFKQKVVKKNTATSLKLTKLKSKKVYYVRVCTYKTVKQTYYDNKNKKHTYSYKVLSKPSKVIKVKTK